VSVLFADLVGFTTLAEGRDAEAVRDMLSSYFEMARTVIERYGGTVEKFIGDAVMALWGAPIAHEDDAERAVRAALELLVDVRALGPEVQARAGVMTGEAAVTIGAVGQGMVAGDLVNTASRLQSVAAPGTVLVGEATQRAASQAITFEPAGPQQLKGKESPVPAYLALRVVSRRKGAGRSDRLEAPFVGRDAQLRLLKDVFHATGKEQRARLVSITGQAGIGKTRLAWEFQKYVDGVVEAVWWHEGRSPSYGEGVTFWALGEMIRSRAGLLETDEVETTREKVAATVREHVPDPEERALIEPALLALLGAGEPPPGGRDELFQAWRTFFERMAATGTVGLLFEDLQWADPGLLDFIDHLLEWSRGVPILIVTLARPDLLERRPDWGAGRRNFIALELEPLDETEMREVLRGLVPGLPPDTVRSIIARADGIPLYAVETIRMLVSDGRLRETETGYEPVGALGELAVPETLQALIAARLDALDPADRTLLQDAAVLGHSFTLAGLEAVSGESKEALAGRLRQLARADLVNQDVDPRSPERGMYAFVQALIREVAYGTLAKRDRRARHLAAARFFESLGDDELAGALAAHYLAAYEAAPDGPEGEALGTQARISLVAAADRAIALGSPEQAVAFLDQARRVVTDPAERADILERAGRAAVAALRLEEGQEAFRVAIDLRRSLSQTGEMFAAINELANAYILGRHPAAAGALIESVLDEAERAGDADRAALYTRLARVRFGEDRVDEALRFADMGLALAEQLELHEVVIEGLTTRGGALSKMGRPAEAFALTEGARRLSQEHGLAGWELRATVLLSLLVATGDPKAAVTLAGTGIELARRIGRRGEQLLLIGNAGEDAFRVGDWDWQAAQLATLDHLELDKGTLLTMQLATLVVSYLRGSVDRADLIEQLDSAQEHFDDPDTESARWDVRAWLDFADGRFREATANWTKVTEISALNTPYVLPRIAHASLLIGDAAGAADALNSLLKTSARGRAVDVEKAAIEAGIAAIEGRTADAIAGYRATLAEWHDLGLVWDEVLTSLVFVTLFGADLPEARRAAESARELMVARGGVKVVGLLDAALASGEASQGSRSAEEVPAAS
jgi:class 3 adenylate cyclase